MRLLEHQLLVVVSSGQFDSGRMANRIDKSLLSDSCAYILAPTRFKTHRSIAYAAILSPWTSIWGRNPTPLAFPAMHFEKVPDTVYSPRKDRPPLTGPFSE